MANPTKSATLKRADSGMGVTETGTNHTKFNTWFYGSNVSAPWCAIFVCWILIGAGFKFSKNASAWELGSQLSGASGWRRVSAGSIDSGDVVVYHISHIGLCKSRKSGGYNVYEGNHGNKSAVVSRTASQIQYGVRPPYAPEVTAPIALTPSSPTERTMYIVHGSTNHDPGQLMDDNGWEYRYPSPAIGSNVYPASELGAEYSDCLGNVWIPIKWSGTNSIGEPNNGWYRKDYLQWAT